MGDRKEVKDLLETGRQKGFLTYDEPSSAAFGSRHRVGHRDASVGPMRG